MVTFQIITDFFGISHHLYIGLMSTLSFDSAKAENNSYKSSKGLFICCKLCVLTGVYMSFVLPLLSGNNWMRIFPVRVTMRFLFGDSREG
ncbi:hypothetical protein D3C80_1411340 [compost metagenome]